MPFPSFLYLEGQSQGFISRGACDTGSLPHDMNTGPEDTIRVDEFTWHTHLPVDPHHGQPTGVWQPGEVTLTKLHDRSTPLLHESLCRGERFAHWDFYGQEWRDGGQGLMPVFRLQLYGAHVVKIRTRLPHCQNPAEQDMTVLEEVTFGYAGFTVEHLRASTIGGGGKHENPRPLAQAYRRTVAYFNRVFSGAAFKDSVRDLDRTLGRALGDPLKGVPGDPSALLGMLGGGGIAGVVKKGVAKGAKSADDIFKAGRVPKASELKKHAESQGWKPTQMEGGPLKYVDENGIPRVTIKQGSSRTPGSGSPHVELRDASGQRIDPFGNPVTRKSPGNHTSIDYDL